MLQVIPAIDLMNGQVVRLREGRRDQVTVYNHDPEAQIAELIAAGADRIHVVDLDGAFAGDAKQATLIARLCANSSVPVQIGGGLRNLASMQAALDAGADRVVVGTAAVEDDALLREACSRLAGRIVVAVDARDGMVAVKGWTEKTDRRAVDLARHAESVGAVALLYTDIARDGMATGPNVHATVDVQNAVSIPVIASGGISGLADIVALRDAGLRACVVGRALYSGALDLGAALRATRPTSPEPES